MPPPPHPLPPLKKELPSPYVYIFQVSSWATYAKTKITLIGTPINRHFLSSSVLCAVRQEVVKTVAGGGGQRGEYTGKPEYLCLEFKKKSIIPPRQELKPLPLAMATS